MKKFIKWLLIVVAVVVVSVVSFGYWFISLLPAPTVSREEMKKTDRAEIPYLSENQIPNRGKVLAIVTSHDVMGSSGKSTGYELTELSRTYYVLEANGFEVDIASPKGGTPPVVIDGDDMRGIDYAFLNDPVAQKKVANSIAVKDVNPDDYEAIFFAGGKGAMFDFPQDVHIQNLVRNQYEGGKVVAAVCHGPAALTNVKLSNGEFLLKDKQISSFTNEEELFLIPDAEEIFPFLLQSKLEENGAKFQEGVMYLNQVSVEENLISGQNPWSTWEVAEMMVRQLGYDPKPRIVTPEEYSVQILETYENDGYQQAKSEISNYIQNDVVFDRELIAVHGIVAAMQFELSKTANLIGLLRYCNSFNS